MRAAGLARCTALGVVLAGTASGAFAQAPVSDFGQLPTRVRTGDTVIVTDTAGREHKGKLHVLAPASLVIEAAGKRVDFPSERVAAMTWQQRDSLGNGAWIGFATAAGMIGILAASSCEGDECRWVVPLAAGFYGAVGAGIGVGIDALIPGKKILVYSRAAGSARASVSLSPILHTGRQGLAATVRF